MIRVLIVDDEVLVRIGIISCIQWELNGFEIVGQAEDGLQALEMIYMLKPDLILTDIRMPNMNGIELIEKVRSGFKNTRIIVLSCLDEIEYVKNAIKLGANDYILKLSLKPDRLLQILLTIKDEINRERKSTVDNSSSGSVEYLDRLEFKRSIFKRYLNGSIPPAQFIQDLRSIDMDIDYDRFIVIVTRIDNYKKFTMSRSIENQETARTALVSLVAEHIGGVKAGVLEEIEDGEYLVILRVESDEYSGSHEVDPLINNINHSFEKYLNITASFCVSTISASPGQILESYVAAKSAFEHRFYSGSSSLIHLEDAKAFDDHDVFIEEEEEERLRQLSQIGDFNGVQQIIDCFIDKVGLERAHMPSKVKIAVANILYNVLKILRREEKSGFGKLHMDNKFIGLIMDSETIVEVRSYADSFLDELNKQLTVCRRRSRPEILKIRKYINENINRDISLEEASKMANISRSYFSQIFKKEVGTSYSDYVNRVKMNMARELVIDKDMKIYEVAEMLGYKDESYFYKLFRKYNGDTPGKLRRMN